MNAVEIEEAVSQLAEAPFDAEEFPFAFLEAFGNKPTTLKRLRDGSTNSSDISGAVLQRNNIHILVSAEGAVQEALDTLRKSPATTKSKVKYILATDGKDFESENLVDGTTVACSFGEFADHFGFFLPLAGITTVKEISENAFDIKATARLNRLYVELLKDNKEWEKDENKPKLNHFMARLIFCFFAEDTGIFGTDSLFTSTIEQMSSSDSSNTHEVIAEAFRSMSTTREDRDGAGVKRWATKFPYVNGGLFSGDIDVPRLSKIARSYLLHVGRLDWTKINPDIFGSMIQAVADDEERGSLGMHYTSVPNILKVLNPLFLDELRVELDRAGENKRKLIDLRKRLTRIRVFDPACGSGNFLVIAYKEMRAIQHDINLRLGEPDKSYSTIPLTNFRGIEIRHFSAEIARLALTIAEFQCNALYLGKSQAIQEFLPLKDDNWVVCGNALQIDWFNVCPPSGGLAGSRLPAPNKSAGMASYSDEYETYICGNPPYLGSTWQSPDQKSDLKALFCHRVSQWKLLDYVAGWFMKAVDYGSRHPVVAAFVSTNSICQGQQVPILWPLIGASGFRIQFAFASFKWKNLASNNAGVTVVIVGISNLAPKARRIYETADTGEVRVKTVENINAYLCSGPDIIVKKAHYPQSSLSQMTFGNKAVDGGHLLLTASELEKLDLSKAQMANFIRRHFGSAEVLKGVSRYCLWIESEHFDHAMKISSVAQRVELVRTFRLASRDKGAQELAARPHQFREMNFAKSLLIVVPRVTSENRPYLPVGILSRRDIIGDRNFALYDAPLWNMALIASRLHWVWVGTVCVRLEMRFSYSNTLGWNTFPVPTLTEQNKEDLTRCAENILLVREAHFPASIAELYDPDEMPADLREAHAQNDEVIERIYIGRRFKNDTERLEKLFELYTKMTANEVPTKKKAKGEKNDN